LQKKCPELCHDKWILHNDNTPAFDALRVRKFLAEHPIKWIIHLIRLTEPSAIFGLFQNLKKNVLNGQRFADIAYIQFHTTTLL
jgi:hypothetical protein